ncbi:MAG: sulfatase-like hydrolase/transferase, partial [Opitutae bacterium]|nr:sulfatase-like hydrolase/transferase [Opitutae bacterium]
MASFINLAWVLVLWLTADCFAVFAGEGKPNFLQILTDDQGWGDLRSYGHIFLDTPHLDQLAEEGIKFTHCYSSGSVCSPSRSSILSGSTPYRNGVLRFIPADHY